MNTNTICTDGWSNPETEATYINGWPESPELKLRHARADAALEILNSKVTEYTRAAFKTHWETRRINQVE